MTINPKQVPYVFIDNEQIPLNQDAVEFLDIEEGPLGDDRVTFLYHGKKYESPIILKNH